MEEGKSKATTDHEEIRTWVESRGGKPARVINTGNGDPGILRIRFRGDSEDLEEITWEEFFDKFEKNSLAFLYQDRTADNKESRFFKLIKR